MKDKYCVHLDFHTSEEIDGIGKDFSVEEFSSALTEAGLDSINIFAKCHHGNFYYKSERFHTHPYLTKPLLDLQLEACKRAGVSAKLYISAGLDEYNAKLHPEWLVVLENGQPQNMLEPHFHRLCFASPYMDELEAQTVEVTEKYMPDGLFFDIIGETDCNCRWCRAQMAKKGYDYKKHSDVHQQAVELYQEMTRRLTAAARAIKPDILLFFNGGDFPVGRHDRIDVNNQLEAESLPTGGWGYDHFPMSMAYIRRQGKNCIGMTGKFNRTWGEFGGFKYENALIYEGAQCLAFDAGMCVGDQLHPTGRVDSYTYSSVGKAMSYIKQRDGWRGGEFQAELAILGDDRCKARDGIGRILFEDKYQFDLIAWDEIDNRYPLIVVTTDNRELTENEYNALRVYVEKGGKILACNKAALYKGQMAFDLGAVYLGDDDFQPTYIRAKYHLRTADGMALAAYGGTSNIQLTGTLLAEKVRPYFKREGTHFCSHNNTPCNYDTLEAGITEGKHGVYCCTDLFADYASGTSSLADKQLILPLIERLLNSRKLIRTNLPSSGKAVLYRKDDRYILHLLYANTIKRGEGIEIIEDIVTIADIDLSLDLPNRISTAITHPEEKVLPVQYENGRTILHLDKMWCSEIIELK